MLPDIEQLRVTYKNLPDDKLTRLAVNEARSLRPEALELLKNEIKSRGLDEGVLNGINVQLTPINENQLNDYLSIIRGQPCPVCNTTGRPLNAILSHTVVSIILFTRYDKKMNIACPECLQKARQAATLKSTLLGWWGLPWGIIRTSQALIRNHKTIDQIQTNAPTDLLLNYVLKNAGVIESIRNNKQALQTMLTDANRYKS